MRNDTIKKPEKLGLSALLAIIIGLVITIVAGILLAQLYFSYAGTISARPAANVEYVDLIETSGAGTNDILILNIKNIGSVPIIDVGIDTDGDGSEDDICVPDPLAISPGEVQGLTCDIPDASVALGGTYSTTLIVQFDSDGDGTVDSVQSYAISVRARSA